MSVPTPPPLPSVPIDKAPTTGAAITLADGREVRVHPECKRSRDLFVDWHRRQYLDSIADMARKKIISPDEAVMRRSEAFEHFGAGRFDHGSKNNFDKRYTDAGIKQQMAIRVSLAHEATKDGPHPDLVEQWVDEQGADVALAIMALADGHAPKSSTPADGPPSAGISSGSTAG